MMAVRMLEMRRVLAPTGSIYLHCDPTASHYLRSLMDAVFGRQNFRNEIVWKRTAAHARGIKKLAAIHDVIVFYAVSDKALLNPVYRDHDPAYIRQNYRHQDSHGRFRSDNLTAAGTRHGDSGLPWRGIDPSDKGSHWNAPGAFPSHIQRPLDWDALTTREKLGRLDEFGLVLWPERGNLPAFKRYLSTTKGKPVADMIDDISPINSQARERTGYPTQKPLALLARIIETSSNPGDVVLDPFCGCATACVAADNLQREWVGIDISPMAVELVHRRLRDTLGELYHAGMVTARTDIPQRTDIEAPINYRQNRHVLFGEQEGKCNGCQMEFPFKMFEVDHQVPRSRGGTDHKSNLQLLCSPCNRIKGDRPMEYLMARLAEYSRPA